MTLSTCMCGDHMTSWCALYMYCVEITRLYGVRVHVCANVTAKHKDAYPDSRQGGKEKLFWH